MEIKQLPHQRCSNNFKKKNTDNCEKRIIAFFEKPGPVTQTLTIFCCACHYFSGHMPVEVDARTSEWNGTKRYPRPAWFLSSSTDTCQFSCCHFTSASPGVSASRPWCFSRHIYQGCFALTCSSIHRRAFHSFQSYRPLCELERGCHPLLGPPTIYQETTDEGQRGGGLPWYILRIQKKRAGFENKQWWNWMKRDATQGLRKLKLRNVDMWHGSIHPPILQSIRLFIFHLGLFFTLSCGVSWLLKGDGKKA